MSQRGGGAAPRAEVWDESGNDTAVDAGVLAPPPAPTPIDPGTHFRVPVDAGWMDSGIVVGVGAPLEITASGEALTASLHAYRNARSGPDGQPTICWEDYALNGAPFGALVGRIGADGEPFVIGSSCELVPAQAGTLYLTVNDIDGNYEDNRDSFMVFFNR